jgi:hypothetical protein
MVRGLEADFVVERYFQTGLAEDTSERCEAELRRKK